MTQFKTTHDLPFEVADWQPLPGSTHASDFKRFRIGTCEGLWASTPTSYDILSVINNSPGNGHFNDVLEWFYSSCLRDRKKLRILEVWNPRLKKHLIEKRGFVANGISNVEKSYKQIKKRKA
jgi:hypothetical protein